MSVAYQQTEKHLTDGGSGMTYNSDELVQYLSLSKQTQLRYVIDADALEVFQVTSDGKQVLYEGGLKDWLQQICGGEDEKMPISTDEPTERYECQKCYKVFNL